MFISLPFILSPATAGQTPSPEDNLPKEQEGDDTAGQDQKAPKQTSQTEGALTEEITLSKDEYAQLVNQANLAKLGQSIQSERDRLRDEKAKLEAQLEMYKGQLEKQQQPQQPSKTPIDEFLERRLKKRDRDIDQSDSFFEEETPQLTQDVLIDYGKAILDTVDKRMQTVIEEKMKSIGEQLSKTKSEIQAEQQQRDRIKETKEAIEKQMEKLTSELAVKYNAPENLVSDYRQLLELRAVKWKEFEDAEDAENKSQVIYELAQLEDAIEAKKDEMKAHKAKSEREARAKASLPESSVIPVDIGEPSKLREGETEYERNLRDAIESFKRAQKFGP